MPQPHSSAVGGCQFQTLLSRTGYGVRMSRTAGIDANKHGLVLEIVPGPRHTFPERLAPADDSAHALASLTERLAGYFESHEVDRVAVVADLGRSAPSDVYPRGLMEAAVMIAASRVGATFTRPTMGEALKHLGLPANGNKRGRLRESLTEHLGANRLSPDPDKRAAALGVALLTANLSPEDVNAS